MKIGKKIAVEVCLSPALYKFYKDEGDVVIIVDIFRATTTMCMALENGAAAIIPVSTTDKAKEYKQMGYLVGAERNVKRCDFADFGNSPFEYTRDKVEGREIVFTTTNGTHAIEEAKDCYELLIGSFSNISKLAERCAYLNRRVVILCSGWNNTINIEDTLFAGALIEKLHEAYSVNIDSDSAIIALTLWQKAKFNIHDFVEKSEHFQRLKDNGLEECVEHCLKCDTTNIVPYYVDGKLKCL